MNHGPLALLTFAALLATSGCSDDARELLTAREPSPHDDVIPIEAGGDLVAKLLREDGSRVRYVRSDGGHRPVPAIVRRFVRRAAG